MAIISRNEQMVEAIERLNIIDSDEHLILDKFKDGFLLMSEYQNKIFDAVLYEMNDELQAYIDEFEKNYQALVYHVQMTPTVVGKMYSLFYVGRYKEDWELEKADLKEGYAFVYVWNKDVPQFSEFGSIAFKNSMGGIMRIG